MVKSVQVIVLKSKIVQKLLTAYKKLRFSASKVMELLQEKESWSSVWGFGMETSNFALNRCLRVFIDRFFDARLNHGLRISLRTL